MVNKWQDAAKKIRYNEEIVQNDSDEENLNVTIKDFRYIIQRQTPAPICFGTKQERECLPLRGKGLSTFMKYYSKPYYPDISPNTYDYATKTSFRSSKKISHTGTLPLSARFKEDLQLNFIPPSTKYSISIFPKRIRKSKIPFGSSSGRTKQIMNQTPGPGTYEVDVKKCTALPFSHSFSNGPKKLIAPIPIECIAINLIKCDICHQPPLVDYWQKNHSEILCLQCYSEEWDEMTKYSREELQKYSLARTCSFMHEHNRTKVFISTLEPEYLKKKLYLETYFSQYFTEFLPQPTSYVKLDHLGGIDFKDKEKFYGKFKQHLKEIKQRERELRDMIFRNT